MTSMPAIDGFDIYDAVGAGMPAATNFRWPIDRVVSVYRYFRYVVEITDVQARDPRFRAGQPGQAPVAERLRDLRRPGRGAAHLRPPLSPADRLGLVAGL
ncbi:hypothetical protein ACRAWD_24480 [Caulobacter segnis]